MPFILKVVHSKHSVNSKSLDTRKENLRGTDAVKITE